MKKITFSILLCNLISFAVFAQKNQSEYRPRLIQTSFRIGAVNSGINLEYRLNPKTTESIELGIGMTHLRSNYYNRFNRNQDEHNMYFDNILNFLYGVVEPLQLNTHKTDHR